MLCRARVSDPWHQTFRRTPRVVEMSRRVRGAHRSRRAAETRSTIAARPTSIRKIPPKFEEAPRGAEKRWEFSLIFGGAMEAAAREGRRGDRTRVVEAVPALVAAGKLGAPRAEVGLVERAREPLLLSCPFVLPPSSLPVAPSGSPSLLLSLLLPCAFRRLAVVLWSNPLSLFQSPLRFFHPLPRTPRLISSSLHSTLLAPPNQP